MSHALENPDQHLQEFGDDRAAVLAHMEALHPDYEYLNADKSRTPFTAHWTFHKGEWAHRAVATHLIEGHGYSVQTVRNNPSPQLTIEHVRLHNDEFADTNESAWNHTHEPPRVWEPEIHAEDVVGRIVVIKVRRQDKGKWLMDGALKELQQQGAMMVLFMDTLDTLETLSPADMEHAGWVHKDRLKDLRADIDEQIEAYNGPDGLATMALGATLDQIFYEKYGVALDD